MPDEKKTVQVDRLEVMHGMLEKFATRTDSALAVQAAKSEALDAKVDAHRAEGARRGEENATKFKSLATGLEAVRVEQVRMGERLAHAESDIRGLKEEHVEKARAQSNHDLEHEATIAGAIVHVKTVDGALGELRGSVENLEAMTKQRLKAQDEVLKAQTEVAASTKADVESTKADVAIVKETMAGAMVILAKISKFSSNPLFKLAIFVGGLAGGAAYAWWSHGSPPQLPGH